MPRTFHCRNSNTDTLHQPGINIYRVERSVCAALISCRNAARQSTNLFSIRKHNNVYKLKQILLIFISLFQIAVSDIYVGQT